ncbi:protein QUIRKY-like [Gossypium australe]|uniref:Protein QUIRKY-like n=1 Tax=Gossypium australe TaxID=47621 RepID=A0A5B6WJR9_9ROSI|nr:protein QUIRKY-like [Gossypium australe]
MSMLIVCPNAWHLDSAIVNDKSLLNTSSKAYLLQRLWYLQVNVIQARDLVLRVIIEDVILRTRVFLDKNVNPKWNEDWMFVVVEPFSNPLVVTVEGRLENRKYVSLLYHIEQRILPLPDDPLWCNLSEIVFEGMEKKVNFFSKLNMSVSLKGGYHVFDESIPIGSNYRPTAKMLWTTMIEVLELGIINASGLQPMNRANPGDYFEVQSCRAQK